MKLNQVIAIILLCAFSLPPELPGRSGPTRRRDNVSLIIESSDFKHHGMIPVRFTCEGENISPELHWSGVPETAESLVLIVDDPDAPDPAAPKRIWVHWVLYDIPPGVTTLSAGQPGGKTGGGIGTTGINDSGVESYRGPCPPIGTHRYFFKLHALNVRLRLPPGKTKRDVVMAMDGHILATAELIGLYKKQKTKE